MKIYDLWATKFEYIFKKNRDFFFHKANQVMKKRKTMDCVMVLEKYPLNGLSTYTLNDDCNQFQLNFLCTSKYGEIRQDRL